MPGPYNYPSRPPCSKSICSLRPPKRPKASVGAAAVERGDADMKKGIPDFKNANTCMKNVRVRVICTDPDATDSSSDEEADANPAHARTTSKRVVRELLLPAGLALAPSLPGSHGEGHVDVKVPVRKRRRNESRSSTVPCLGVRQRRCGKWAAEIRDTSRGVRATLGTFPLSEAQTVTNFTASRQESAGADPRLHADASGAVKHEIESEPLCSTLDTLQDSSLGASPAISENADSAGSCFFVNSPPSVLGPESVSPAFLCIPYGSPRKGFSDVFSDECSDDSISDIVQKDEESNMTDCLTVVNDTFQQKESNRPEPEVDNGDLAEVDAGNAELELEMEASMLAFSFSEGISCFDELGQFFENDSACMDEVPDVGIEFNASLTDTDIDFDLDTEALAWINVPDPWQNDVNGDKDFLT